MGTRADWCWRPCLRKDSRGPGDRSGTELCIYEGLLLIDSKGSPIRNVLRKTR